jgi:hypothetical protein
MPTPFTRDAARGDFVSGSDHLPARHPGAGRDPVATTPAQAARLLDSGLRRNDEQKHEADMRCTRLRVFEIIPDGSAQKQA